MMEQSEIFYDAQFKDAKMVFNVSLISYFMKIKTKIRALVHNIEI
jgi:hypothetical protein